MLPHSTEWVASIATNHRESCWIKEGRWRKKYLGFTSVLWGLQQIKLLCRNQVGDAMLRRESETERDKRGFCRRREAVLLSARWSQLIKLSSESYWRSCAFSHVAIPPWRNKNFKTSCRRPLELGLRGWIQSERQSGQSGSRKPLEWSLPGR